MTLMATWSSWGWHQCIDVNYALRAPSQTDNHQLLEPNEMFNLECNGSVKWNEWGFMPLLCTQFIGYTGQGKPLEDGEMNAMTVPSRHRIQNSSPGSLSLSTLPLGHGGSPQYRIFTSERGRNISFLWNLKARVGFEPAIADFSSRQL